MLNTVYDYLKLTLNKKDYIVNMANPSVLKVPNGQIEYSRFGSGEPLVLVMGYGGSMNGWDVRFLNELAQNNEVIVFSNRNTGRSYSSNKDYTVVELATDIELLRSNLNLNKISLCGISMGGIITQQYAYMYPSLLKSIILINSLPPGNLIFMPNTQTIETLRNLSERNLATYFKLSNILFPSIWQVSNLMLFHFKPGNSKNIVPSETLKEQQKVLDDWSELTEPDSYLQSIATPTLIQVGKLDQLIPPSNSKMLNLHLTNSKLLEYKNGGHVMIYQEPILLAKDIVSFLNVSTNNEYRHAT